MVSAGSTSLYVTSTSSSGALSGSWATLLSTNNVIICLGDNHFLYFLGHEKHCCNKVSKMDGNRVKCTKHNTSWDLLQIQFVIVQYSKLHSNNSSNSWIVISSQKHLFPRPWWCSNCKFSYHLSTYKVMLYYPKMSLWRNLFAHCGRKQWKLLLFHTLNLNIRDIKISLRLSSHHHPYDFWSW